MLLLLLKNELKGELNELDELMDLVVEMLVWLRSGWNFTTKCCWLKKNDDEEWMDGWYDGNEWIELNGMEWNGCVLLERWLLCWVWVEEELLKIYFVLEKERSKRFVEEVVVEEVVGCWLLVVGCWLLVAILKMEK